MQAYTAQKAMDWRQCLVLVNIARDSVRLAAQPCGPDCGLSGQALGARRIAVAHAKDDIVPLDVHRWLRWAPTPTEQVAFHRTYLKLEASALVSRINLYGGRRTTHLRLTATGPRLAARLLAEDAAAEHDQLADRPAGRDAHDGAEHAGADDLPEPFDLDSLDWSMLQLPDPEPGEPGEPGEHPTDAEAQTAPAPVAAGPDTDQSADST